MKLRKSGREIPYFKTQTIKNSPKGITIFEMIIADRPFEVVIVDKTRNLWVLQVRTKTQKERLKKNKQSRVPY
jgi:hypothetical protein